MTTKIQPLISREARKSAERLLKQSVGHDLFDHSKRVEETARDLAKRFELDESVAGIAGLLHDCAKELSDEELLQRASGNGIQVFRVDKLDPQKLHARVGAIIAGEKYGIVNPDVLAGIRCHSYGERRMCDIAKVTIIADDIEPERDDKIADPIKDVLKSDGGIDLATLAALSMQLIKSGEKLKPVHPLLTRSRNYLAHKLVGHKHKLGLLD